MTKPLSELTLEELAWQYVVEANNPTFVNAKVSAILEEITSRVGTHRWVYINQAFEIYLMLVPKEAALND